MEYDPKQGIRDREKAALPDLKAKLSAYVDAFNAADEELYTELIPNRDASAYLADQIPLLECPDKTIEQTYYFRWWTLGSEVETSGRWLLSSDACAAFMAVDGLSHAYMVLETLPGR